MRGAELYRNFVPQSKDFCISIGSLYWAFEETPNAIKNVWEPKEGGRASS